VPDLDAVFAVRRAGADLLPLVERLVEDDALGQLLDRRDTMARLATEAGDVKLDWVDQLGLARMQPSGLHDVAALATALRDAGVERLIWSGMGGSVQAVACLNALGWVGTADLEIVPLDSTDPRVLERLGRRLGPDALRRTGIVAVSMGMTSEEPIAHLRWFDTVAASAGVDDYRRRQLVMTLPGSYLDAYATEHGITSVPLQLDGANHVAGRMSAPATRVFLLPAALTLDSSEALVDLVGQIVGASGIRPGLTRSQRDALTRTDPFVALGAWLGAQLADGRDMVLLDTDETLRALVPWIEQLVEESLCKSDKGLLVFADQHLGAHADPARLVRLEVRARTATSVEGAAHATGDGDADAGRDRAQAAPLLDIPTAAFELRVDAAEPAGRLAGAGRLFAGWSLVVAVVGYLADLVFAGQPGVESYKRYARELRDAPGPLPFPTTDLVPLVEERDGHAATIGSLWLGALDARRRADVAAAASTLPAAAGHGDEVARHIAATVFALRAATSLAYLDLTVNGDPTGPDWARLHDALRRLAGEVVGVPCKIRSGPRDYHSTEQSQVDGPPEMLSLRVAVRNLPAVGKGHYDDRFFQAQSLGTVLALRDAGRPVLLALLDDDNAVGALADAVELACDLVAAG
jgi:glucose-6-phosphate isomerase